MGFLKERRTQLRKELREIAEVTRIKGAYLRAIEDEDFGKLPEEVYTRGYIKEYAKFLGIGPDLALEPYEKYLAEKKVWKEKYHEKKAAALPRELVESLEAFKGSDGPEHFDKLLLPEVTAGSSDKKKPYGKILSVFLAVVIATGIYFLISAGKNTPRVQQSSHSQSLNHKPAPVESPVPDINASKVYTGADESKPQKPAVSSKNAEDKELLMRNKLREQNEEGVIQRQPANEENLNDTAEHSSEAKPQQESPDIISEPAKPIN